MLDLAVLAADVPIRWLLRPQCIPVQTKRRSSAQVSREIRVSARYNSVIDNHRHKALHQHILHRILRVARLSAPQNAASHEQRSAQLSVRPRPVRNRCGCQSLRSAFGRTPPLTRYNATFLVAVLTTTAIPLTYRIYESIVSSKSQPR